MSEPLSGSGTAVALGGATVFGLFTGTDFGIVFGAFALVKRGFIVVGYDVRVIIFQRLIKFLVPSGRFRKA